MIFIERSFLKPFGITSQKDQLEHEADARGAVKCREGDDNLAIRDREFVAADPEAGFAVKALGPKDAAVEIQVKGGTRVVTGCEGERIVNKFHIDVLFVLHVRQVVEEVVENFRHRTRPVGTNATGRMGKSRDVGFLKAHDRAEHFIVLPQAWKQIVFGIDICRGEFGHAEATFGFDRSEGLEVAAR